jgi:hypothetical protein
MWAPAGPMGGRREPCAMGAGRAGSASVLGQSSGLPASAGRAVPCVPGTPLRYGTRDDRRPCMWPGSGSMWARAILTSSQWRLSGPYGGLKRLQALGYQDGPYGAVRAASGECGDVLYCASWYVCASGSRMAHSDRHSTAVLASDQDMKRPTDLGPWVWCGVARGGV